MGARTAAASRLVAVSILAGILLVSAALACLMGWRIGLVTSLVSLLAVVAGGSLGFLLGRQIVAAAEIQPGASTAQSASGGCSRNHVRRAVAV